MATFAIKCPYCLRDNTSFTVRSSTPHWPLGARGTNWTPIETFATCNACFKGVCTTIDIVYPSVDAAIEKHNGTIGQTAYMRVGFWLPAAPMPDVPEHLTAPVSKAFSEAERLRLSGFRGPAGNAYRRALEAALKEVDPTLKGTLYARIEQLAKNGLLTNNMRDFAHRIRNLGNEASHETPDIPDDEIDDLAVFTKLFLMYQFTLPGMLPLKPDGNAQS